MASGCTPAPRRRSSLGKTAAAVRLTPMAGSPAATAGTRMAAGSTAAAGNVAGRQMRVGAAEYRSLIWCVHKVSTESPTVDSLFDLEKLCPTAGLDWNVWSLQSAPRFETWRRSVAAALADGMAALRHALTVGFANRLARRLDRHNGYKTLGPKPVRLCCRFPKSVLG